jgi:hypothetical protein
VVHDQLVLICPACQESTDWTAELERCAKCRSAHLIRRLGQVECLDCGLVREPEAVTLVPVGSPDAAASASSGGRAAGAPSGGRPPGAVTGTSSGVRPPGAVAGTPSEGRPAGAADTTLADEVSRALDRLLGRA